jgi:hypothetical protein
MRAAVRGALAGAAVLALAACATATPYGPADGAGYGYREQRVEANRYIVTFEGNSATGAEAIENAALRRAADLTLQEGYDWFEVVGRGTELEPRRGGGSGVSVGVGGVSGSRGSSVGTSVGLSFPLGGSSGGGGSTSLEVRMGSGAPPEGASVYDAREVSRNLAMAGGPS